MEISLTHCFNPLADQRGNSPSTSFPYSLTDSKLSNNKKIRSCCGWDVKSNKRGNPSGVAMCSSTFSYASIDFMTSQDKKIKSCCGWDLQSNGRHSPSWVAKSSSTFSYAFNDFVAFHHKKIESCSGWDLKFSRRDNPSRVAEWSSTFAYPSTDFKTSHHKKIKSCCALGLQFKTRKCPSWVAKCSSGFSFSFTDLKTSNNKKIRSCCSWDVQSNKRRNQSCVIKCSSLEQGLKPKPRPKQTPIVEEPDTKSDFEGAHFAKTLCEQIEKLGLFKRYEEAIELFEILQLRGSHSVGPGTYELLIDACISLKSARAVKLVFRHMIETGFEFDQYMRNRVLLMHIKCGMLADAQQLFEEMPERNVVSWNTMMSCFVGSGSYRDALDMFLTMQREVLDAGARTFVTIIRASAGLGLVSVGRQLHTCVVKMGLYGQEFVSCALIDMYSKCGCIEKAQWVFDEMPEKTVVGWNSIIAGYTLHGYSETALEMYYEMYSSGVKMDHFTYSIVIRVCTQLGSVDHGRQIHACIVRNGFEFDVVVNTALMDFYCKWGRMEDARHVFDMMPCKNLISWNALIGGYGNHGMGDEAIAMFERMVKEGMVPNHVTFLAVLGACSYSGLLDKGREFFELLTQDPKTRPRAMHYACMIELLGREGLLDEAFSLIKNAPFTPTTNMWAALLTACRIHKNLELGKFAAERLFGMEPEKLSNYVVLLNVYNNSGRKEDAARVLDTLNRKGLRFLPACSWIEIKKQPQKFLFGDKSHPESIEIYRRLDVLMKKIRSQGYIPDGKSILPDVGEEEQQMSSYHSEKLAIAFGLISTPDSTPLQVVQGHRICSDCHNVIKLMTVVTRREIVVRDASRFHYFRHGTCSCGDYW